VLGVEMEVKAAIAKATISKSFFILINLVLGANVSFFLKQTSALNILIKKNRSYASVSFIQSFSV
jgi:hypothetical protein